MTDLDLLLEERSEIQGEINRLKGSMNKQDNGVKIDRIRILSRTIGRLDKAIAAHKGAAA